MLKAGPALQMSSLHAPKYSKLNYQQVILIFHLNLGQEKRESKVFTE